GDRVGLVAQKLSSVSPGWSGTHLAAALINAAETLADAGARSAPGPMQIILVSDLQEGSRLDTMQGYDWPKGIELSVEILKPQHVNNAGLQLVADANDTDPQSENNVRVRVNNAADSRQEQFKVGWRQPGGRALLGTPTTVYVPPGQSRTITLAIPASPAGVNQVVLEGDDEDFDNTAFVVPLRA